MSITSTCVHAASEILYNLSPDYQNVDACTEFDRLVCDGFDAKHDIPQDANSYSTMIEMSDTAKTTLWHILTSPYPGEMGHSAYSPIKLVRGASNADKDNFNKMQTAYNSCLNETALKEAGMQPLHSLITEVARLFPVEENAGADEFGKADYESLSNTIVFLEKLGITTFEYLFTGADEKNPDVVIVRASPAGISLPSAEYYENQANMWKYQSVMENVFGSLLPTNTSRAAATTLAQSVVGLERKIAAMTPPREDMRDVTKFYNMVNVSEAAKIGPAMGFDRVLQALVPSNYSLDSMLLAFPEFARNVSDLLNDANKSTVQAYLIWKTIHAYSAIVEGPEVEPIQVEPMLRFGSTLNGRDPDAKPERWRTCLSHVDNTVGWILSRFFIEAAFSADAKLLGDQIITDIKQQFQSKLNGLSWMDPSVKAAATKKVENIDHKIGYPTKSPDITNPEALRDLYGSLGITDSYFNNTVSAKRYNSDRLWSALGKPVDRGRWSKHADTVNAYYRSEGNEIVFPAGIMQFPVFDVGLPSYVNYGAFGSIGGHELIHAFDNTGRQFDEHGRYRDWWTNHTVEEFTRRTDCFVDQYANFTIEGSDGRHLHVNGKLTLGENIADAGGVSAAFDAWKQHRETGPDRDLPGLDYFTHEQLFYVIYANFWCSKTRKETAARQIYTNVHSPPFARILGTLTNSRGFRESFDCPVKEPTCELW